MMVLESRKLSLLLVVTAALAAAGCIEDNMDPEGLAVAKATGGAQIVFNLDARPFPEIPFPSDLATRLDPTSPTGRRLNVSYLGGSNQEEKVRKYVNRMSLAVILYNSTSV